MRIQEILTILQVKGDYTLSQKEIRDGLKLTDTCYNEEQLNRLILETRLMALIKMLNQDLLEKDDEYQITNKVIIYDAIYLTITRLNEHNTVIIDKDDFINNEYLELVFDDICAKL